MIGIGLPDRPDRQRQALIGRLAQGDRWDLVFNIAEGLYGLAREAQVPAILDVYDIPYTFSDPLVLSLALHKGLTKTVVRQAGIATPDFALVERPADIDAIDLPFPLFAKPVAEGTSKGISGASKILDRAGPAGGLPRPACGSSASRCWSRRSSPAASSPSA